MTEKKPDDKKTTPSELADKEIDKVSGGAKPGTIYDRLPGSKFE